MELVQYDTHSIYITNDGKMIAHINVSHELSEKEIKEVMQMLTYLNRKDAQKW